MLSREVIRKENFVQERQSIMFRYDYIYKEETVQAWKLYKEDEHGVNNGPQNYSSSVGGIYSESYMQSQIVVGA